MDILFILLLLIIFIAYYVIWPISKKRPVLIKSFGVAITLFAISIITFLDQEIWLCVGGLILGFCFLLKRSWFIVGVSRPQITDALQRAATATRTEILTINNSFAIEAKNAAISIRSIGSKTNWVFFSTPNRSKKTILTIEVFRKFILNYFWS